VPLSDVRASEFVYHLAGRVAFYRAEDERFTELPGASDPGYVQTHPFWSPDGQYLYFARDLVQQKLLEKYAGKEGFEVAEGTDIAAMNRLFMGFCLRL